MTDDNNKFPEAQTPCHVCGGEGVCGDHVFSNDVQVCHNCGGTGEEPPLRKVVRRRKRDRTLP